MENSRLLNNVIQHGYFETFDLLLNLFVFFMSVMLMVLLLLVLVMVDGVDWIVPECNAMKFVGKSLLFAVHKHKTQTKLYKLYHMICP